jgi:hypothetical protein
MHRVVIYPSGLVFYGLWNLLQWVLDPVTRRKVCPQVSPNGIFEYIDPQFVPIDIGGSSTYEPDIALLEDPPIMMHRPLQIKTSLPRFQIEELDLNSPISGAAANDYESSSEYIGEYNDHMEMVAASAPSRSSIVARPSSLGLSFHTARGSEPTPGHIRGWAAKQGHFFKNWLTRYFILSSDRYLTLLSYFIYESNSPPFGRGLKGEMNLREYSVVQINDRTLYLHGSREVDKDLVMRFSTDEEAAMWKAALETHIAYRKSADDDGHISKEPSTYFSCILI